MRLEDITAAELFLRCYPGRYALLLGSGIAPSAESNGLGDHAQHLLGGSVHVAGAEAIAERVMS